MNIRMQLIFKSEKEFNYFKLSYLSFMRAHPLSMYYNSGAVLLIAAHFIFLLFVCFCFIIDHIIMATIMMSLAIF